MCYARGKEEQGCAGSFGVPPSQAFTHVAGTPDSHQYSGWVPGKSASSRRRLTSHHFTVLQSVSLRRVTRDQETAVTSYSYGERDYAFGQLILTLRTTIGLSQAGLGGRLGVS